MIRGDLYWANLNPRSGSEQTGRRPVLIISHDSFNRAPKWCSIIVVPISTSARQAIRSPTVVCIPRGVGGLQSESCLLCHQVTTLDRSKLKERIGTLPISYLLETNEALKAALALD